ADTFTASRRAVATLYSGTIAQAQALAYVDVYVLLVGLFTFILFMLPWMRRVRIDQTGPKTPAKPDGRVEGLPAAATD
ncbi:MAG TPA: hypothetical protein VEA38_20455, partial [Terriglobales bacterium]|nr:hypothetical protein [Terriglobales bacterium]